MVLRKAATLAAMATTVLSLYNLSALLHLHFREDSGIQLDSAAPRVLPQRDFSGEELQKLEQALSRAAFMNKTVIITTLNRAWSSQGVLDLFLNSFRKGYGISSFLNHLLIVALDELSHKHCLAVHHHCFPLKTSGVDFAAEQPFMSDDFVKLMWRRVYFLGAVLELGYSFVFSDADVLWFRDPFNQFQAAADFEIACDYYPVHHADSAYPNCGFIHTRSNNRTIQLYKSWYRARLLYPGKPDQDVLTSMLFREDFWSLKVKTRFLRTEIFGSFCQVKNRLEQVCTMHANCCIGLDRKVSDLKVVASDWDNYTSLPPHKQKDFGWRAPRECLASVYKGKSVFPVPVRKRKKWLII